MSVLRFFALAHQTARERAAAYILSDAPDGAEIVVKEPTRTSGQNGKFHAICSDLARSQVQWAGKRRNAAQWKVLLVSGHAAALTNIPGFTDAKECLAAGNEWLRAMNMQSGGFRSYSAVCLPQKKA